MFSGQLPQLIDPRKFTDQGIQIEGQTSIGALPRLAEYRDPDNEMVTVALQFGRDEDERRRVTGTVSAHLTMPCQRCLEPVTYQINANVDLIMVWDQEQIKELPEHLDPMMVTEEKVPLSELLEEELLLALPLVAGMIVAAKMPDFAERIRKRTTVAGAAVLGATIVYGIAYFYPILWPAVGLLAGITIMHNTAAFATGAVVGMVLSKQSSRKPPRSRTGYEEVKRHVQGKI